MRFERPILIGFTAPPGALINVIYGLGLAGIAVFEERLPLQFPVRGPRRRARPRTTELAAISISPGTARSRLRGHRLFKNGQKGLGRHLANHGGIYNRVRSLLRPALQSILSGDVPLALALHVPVLITYLAVGAYLLRYIDVEVYLRGRLLAEQAAYALHALADPYIAAAGPIWLAAGLTALASKYGASHLREIGGEVVLSIIEAFIAATANILSFARLAIIYIAHGIFTSAALSLLALPGGVALYFLAQLLIAGFEGFLTAIQSLRLIYYETLSKFYRGSGRLFEPFRLGESADMRRESAS